MDFFFSILVVVVVGGQGGCLQSQSHHLAMQLSHGWTPGEPLARRYSDERQNKYLLS